MMLDQPLGRNRRPAALQQGHQPHDRYPRQADVEPCASSKDEILAHRVLQVNAVEGQVADRKRAAAHLGRGDEQHQPHPDRVRQLEQRAPSPPL